MRISASIPVYAVVLTALLLVALPAAAQTPETASGATELTGQQVYDQLSTLARDSDADHTLFDRLDEAAAAIDWEGVERVAFTGNIRKFEIEVGDEIRPFYLVRPRSGEIYVLALPESAADLEADSTSPYAGLDVKIKHKLDFEVSLVPVVVDGVLYQFAQLEVLPVRGLLDRLFFIAIVLMLFFVMVGMGLTLTTGDFGLVFKKPRGMIVGLICQFGLMPLLAMALGRAFGFYESYPFIFLGMILIAATPGGVTSNLMTYFAKGDVALSVSLTAVCTVLSLFFTPFLLTVFVADIPDFTIPVGEVVKTIMVLVIVPLFVGMLVRAKSENFAKKAEKPFALLGIFALLFLIVVGVWSNLDEFANTERYGFKFYSAVILLTLGGMVVGVIAPKLIALSNFQTRAVSLEVGIRNASLAMTIAILLQDRIGDFSSSMFVTSGIFGLSMYIVGAVAIYAYKTVLPVADQEIAE